MSVYRYKYTGVDTSRLSQVVPGSLVAGNIAPQIYYDVTAPPGSKADLDEEMLRQGWAYDSADPVTTPATQSATDTVAKMNILDTSVLVAKRSVINFIGATIVDVPGSDQVNVTTVPLARTITAGNGLTGGGDLSANRSLAVTAANGSISVGAGGVTVGILANDTMHGDRGGGALHAQVTSLVDGFMIASDKSKLDGVTPGATNTPLSSTIPTAETVGAVGTAGTSTDAARQDHVHPLASGTPSAIGTANAAGTSTSVPHLDHVHDHGSQSTGTHHAAVIAAGASGFMTGSDKTKLDGIAAGATNTPLSNVAGAAVSVAAATAGVSTDVSRSDHTHAVTASVAPSAIGTSNTLGTSDSLAHADHIHDHGSQSTGTHHAAATQAVAGFLSTTDKTKLDGIAASATNTPLAALASPDIDNTAAVVGVGSTAARQDHTHRASVGTPVAVGTANANGTGTALALATHVHDHGTQTSGTLHAVATQSVAGFMSSTDKTSFDNYLPSSGQKDALAGSYGTPSTTNKYVTTTDPAFTGPANVVKLNPGTNVVGAAITAITTATSTNPFVLSLSPGVYTEAPFTMKPYVSICGEGTWFDIQLVTSNNGADFITTAAGSAMEHLAITGPTGAGFAAINSTHTGFTPCILTEVIIKKGYYGINHHPASYGTLHCHELANQYSGSAMNQFVRVTNGNVILMTSSFMSGPSAAVTTGFYVDGATTSLLMFSCAFSNAGSTDGLYVDNGATAQLTGCSFTTGTNAIHIGPSGNSSVSCAANMIGLTFTKGVFIESGTATFRHIGGADYSTWDIANGAALSGIVSDPTGAIILGELSIATGASLFPLGAFASAYATTGLVTGGGISKGTGLVVNIAAGSAFIYNGTAMVSIVWGNTTHTLSASGNKQYIYVDSAGVWHHSSVEPDQTLNLMVGEAATDATDIIALSQHSPMIPQNILNQSRYSDEVIGPISVTGGTVTKHSGTSIQFKVDAATYWIYNNRVTADASADPAVFNYWYRDGAGGWTKVTGQTSIDVTNYDDGTGTLAPMTAAYYKGDLAFVTHNDGAAEFHVVYAQEEQSLSASVLNNPVAPDILIQDGLRLARICVQKAATDIFSISDQRPKIGQSASGSTAITVHAALSGLSADDHVHYQLRSEKGAASGYTPLNGSTKVASTYLDLSSAAPAQISVGGAATGTSTNLARQDHGHDISVGTPVAVAAANNAGAATSLARSDHAHDHGSHSTGTNHAVATPSVSGVGGVNGFISAVNQEKLNNVPAGTDTHIQFNDGGTLGSSANLAYDKVNAAVKIGSATLLPDNPLAIQHSVDSYAQVNLQNTNSGTLASMDIVVTADNGSDSANFFDMGISSSTYADPAYPMLGPDDSFIDAMGGHLVVATYTAAKKLKFATGGQTVNKLRADIDDNGINLYPGHALRTDGTFYNTQRLVRLASTGAVTTSGTPLVDSVQTVLGDRILIKNAGTAANGIYVVAAGAWALAPDWFTGAVLPEQEILVSEGTVNAHNAFRVANTGTITVGATVITFNAFGPSTASPANVTKAAAVVGTSTDWARADHKHDISTAAASTIGTANAEGTATSLARSDHGHDHGAQTSGTLHAAVIAAGASGFMTGSDKTKLDGVATGATNTPLSATVPVNVTKAAASAGSATEAAKQDHKHDVTTAAASTIGTANSEGSATSLARSDHGHDHGAQTSGTLHAVAVAGGANGFLSGADKTKLDASSQSWVQFGNNSVSTTTTTRYLTPGFDATNIAPTAAIQYRAPTAGTIQNMFIQHNTAAGNGGNIVYTVRINSATSALTVTLASTGTNGSDTTHSASVAKGDLLDIQVTKASGIGTSPTNVIATFEIHAA